MKIAVALRVLIHTNDAGHRQRAAHRTQPGHFQRGDFLGVRRLASATQ